MIFLILFNILLTLVCVVMLFITGVAISRNSMKIDSLQQPEPPKEPEKPVVGQKYEPERQLLDLES